MTITLKKDQLLDGCWRAKTGKRHVLISQPKVAVMLGFDPSDADVRQAINDCSRPGDKLADEQTKVVRA